PHPGFGIDGLADGAEQAQAVEFVALGIFAAPLDKGANGSGRGIEDRDFVAVDHLPEAVEVWMIGRAFIHQYRRAVLQWPIDDVGIAGHPSATGGTPEDVLVAEVEDHL